MGPLPKVNRDTKQSISAQKPLSIRRIIQAIKRLNRADRVNGASIVEILRSLHSKKQLIKFDTFSLEKTIRNELRYGVIRILPNGNYIVANKKERSLPLEDYESLYDNDADDSADYEGSNNSKGGWRCKRKNSTFTNDSDLNRRNSAPVRGRPVSQRKKIKKSLGPDFLDPSDLGYQYLRDCYEPKCYFCDGIISSIKQEKFVVCCKCESKAHRKCLLNADISLNGSQWVCNKCKSVCLTCNLPPVSEPLIFCNECRNGYHQQCLDLNPEDPKPKVWVCNKCIREEPDEYYDYYDSTRENSLDPVTENNIGGEKEWNATVSKSDYSSINCPSTAIKCDEKLNKSDHEKLTQSWIIDKECVYPQAMHIDGKNSNDNVDPSEWTVDEVGSFISNIGFPDHAHVFKDEEIDGRSLLLLRRTDVLKGLPLKLGPALKIYAHIHQLQASEFFTASSTLSNQSSDKE